MTTFVVAHGAVLNDWPDVPTFGKRVRAYSDVDTYLLVTNGMAVVASGGVGTPAAEATADGEVPSGWWLTKVEDNIMAAFLTVDTGGGTLAFVGDQLPDGVMLCSDPHGCAAAGRHTCDGVLRLVADDDIVVIACRGEMRPTAEGGYEETGTSTTDERVSIGAHDADTDLTEMLGERVQYYEGLMTSDPARLAREFDELPQGTQAMLLMYPSIAQWSEERWRQHDANREHREGAQAEWVPEESELDAIAMVNRDAVKDTGDEEEVPFVQAGVVVLIGDRHDPAYMDWANSHPLKSAGTITVHKGGMFGAGRLEVAGCAPIGQGAVQAAIGRFSDKEVRFV